MSLLEKPSIYNAQSVYNQGGGGRIPDNIGVIVLNNNSNAKQTNINNTYFEVGGGTSVQGGVVPMLPLIEGDSINDYEFSINANCRLNPGQGYTSLIDRTFSSESNAMSTPFIELNYSNNKVGLRVAGSFINEYDVSIVNQDKIIKISYSRNDGYVKVYIDDVLLVSSYAPNLLNGAKILPSFGNKVTYASCPGALTKLYWKHTYIKVDNRIIWGVG